MEKRTKKQAASTGEIERARAEQMGEKKRNKQKSPHLFSQSTNHLRYFEIDFWFSFGQHFEIFKWMKRETTRIHGRSTTRSENCPFNREKRKRERQREKEARRRRWEARELRLGSAGPRPSRPSTGTIARTSPRSLSEYLFPNWANEASLRSGKKRGVRPVRREKRNLFIFVNVTYLTFASRLGRVWHLRINISY